MNNIRKQRLESQLKREISAVIMREVKDPRVAFVSVHDVSLTNDMKAAHTYISIMGSSEEKEKTLKGLRKGAGFIRSVLGKNLRLKYIPDIRFELDEKMRQKDNILKILKNLETERE
ncbi:MAG TPA: 30S ribosome-binding factor RbfA [Firmicutes bacterium]|nr:30S ribosome-binding factor RbfA [Bacillota bacterium]